ncbi:hypothetical protein C8R43DRAFT_1194951 [Mycena crocata]|nr:hypothetical protein C8R43DRAFT_1194951 [Mycena crocata]
MAAFFVNANPNWCHISIKKACLILLPKESRHAPLVSPSSGTTGGMGKPPKYNEAPCVQGHDSLPLPVEPSRIATPLIWDCWPNGKFQRFFSPQELADTQELATNWVIETIRNRGSAQAVTWEKGKEIRKRCLGVIGCHGRTCSMQLAPAMRAVDRHRQLQQTCIMCDEPLAHRQCGVESSLFYFREGGFFIHSGTHRHSMFTHSSVSCPDGTLVSVDYMPKYTISVDIGPLPVKPELEQLSTSDYDEDTHERQWGGISGDVNVLQPAGSDPVVQSDNMEDDAEEWEMRQDPEADASESETDVPSPDLVFYRPPGDEKLGVKSDGKVIRSVADLPPSIVREKRKREGRVVYDDDEEELARERKRKRGKKWEVRATPPGVRRSTRHKPK